MKSILTDLLAIIGVVLNGLPQGLLALTFGFASVPTALAFFVGAVGNTITQSVAPISFQAETITYAGTAGKRPFGTLYDDFYRRCDYGSDRSVWTADKNRKLCR